MSTKTSMFHKLPKYNQAMLEWARDEARGLVVIFAFSFVVDVIFIYLIAYQHIAITQGDVRNGVLLGMIGSIWLVFSAGAVVFNLRKKHNLRQIGDADLKELSDIADQHPWVAGKLRQIGKSERQVIQADLAWARAFRWNSSGQLPRL